MMKPSKQESVSRQSSILKAPKQRQPLQCVATNPSSSENSPTVKIKRRVSFAKNRRIRQFCNEAEQETVWDNTYEEHDSSHTKSSSSGSPDKPIIISVPSDDKENFPVQLFLKNNQLDCKEVPTNVSVQGDNLSQCDMEMDNSFINPEIGKALTQNNEKEFFNATIYCDDGMDMTSYMPTNVIPCCTVSASLEDTAFVSESCIQDTSIELTEKIPCILSKNFNQEQKNVYSTDLTQALSQLLAARRLNKETDNVLLEDRSENTNTVPMDFTSIHPSYTWIKRNTLCSNNENTENFNNKTMEFTMPCTNIQSNANQKLNNKTRTRLSERTEIFSNKSMEITEVVPVLNKDLSNNYNLKLDNQNLVNEKTEIFSNKSMEMTEAISNYNKKLYPEEKNRILNTSIEMTEIPILNEIHQINANVHDTTQEKTKIFPNKSMEIPEVVPVNKRNSNRHNISSHVFIEKEDKTEVFYNKSIEMTEAIPVLNINHRYENAKEKTRLFFNKSMEITENIPVHKIYQSGADKIDNNRDIFEEITTIFPNVSMEMTEAVHTNKFNKTDANKLQDKTNIFLNKSMEMTGVVPASNQINELSQDKTKIFSNKSMEITEPVYLHKHTDEGLQEKTEIFANKSIEITEAIPGRNRFTQFNTSMELTEAIPKNIEQHISHKDRSLHEDVENRTRMFANKSMDVTETVPINPIILNNHKIENHNTAEKTKIFHKSMDLTDGISVNHKLCELQKLHTNEEKTEHFLNKSMDITEAVPMKRRSFAPQELSKQVLNEDKTEYFLNRSMDITEAIPMNHIPTAPQELPKQVLNEEKTEYFLNKYMDITEAIPINCRPFQSKELPEHYLNEEKTEHFINKSMDITEAIPVQHRAYTSKELPKQDLNQEKTEYFINKSMNVTESIPVKHKALTSEELAKQYLNEEKTEYFTNKSMDMTESVPMQKNAFSNINCKLQKPRIISNEPVADKTKYFTNKSMDITETVVANPNDEFNFVTNTLTNQITQDKTKVFLDKSMDITETLPINQQVFKTKLNSRSNLKTYEKTKIFMDKSMDLTEAIIAGIDNFMSNEKVNENPLNVSKNSESRISHHADINSRLSLHTNTETTSKFIDNVSTLSKDCNLQSKNLKQENYLMNNNSAQIDQDISIEMTSTLPILQTVTKDFPSQTKCDSDKYRQSCLGESNKDYHDISMDYTEPDILSFSKSNSNQLKSSNTQRNLSSGPNKEENKFQRLTTDELQILCASLNLPTQKAEKEQSVISQNTQNFITDCNDVNVLRDSLKNKSNFQKSNILSEGDQSFNIASEVNRDHRISYDLDTGKKNSKRSRLDSVHSAPSIMDFSTFDKSIANKSAVLRSDFNSSKTNVLGKTITIPASMEIDRTAEISLKRSELLEISCNSTKIIPKSNSMNKNIVKAPLIFNDEVPETAEITMAESTVSTSHPPVETNDRNSKVQLYNDISMEFSLTQPTSSSVKRKSSEKNQSPISKKNFISYADKSVHTLESVNSGKENNDVASKENSLCRMPSDSTDVLVATMGFKTELPHPLIINEKTTITVSARSFSKKTYSIGVSSSIQNEIQADKTYVVNKMEKHIELITSVDQKQQEDKNIKQICEIPIVKSNVEENEEQESNSDKENREPKVRENLFPEHHSEELEEIQPPSFLDCDSIQDESLDKREIQKDDLSDSIINNSNKQQSNSFLHKEGNNVNAETDIKQYHSLDVIRRLSNVNLNPPEEMMLKNKKHSKKKKVKKIDDFEEIPSNEINQEIVVPVTPFELLTENIKAQEKRDDCIWSIRSLNSNMIAADFISKSLVLVIRLNAFDVVCNKDIENVQIISRLRPDVKNVLLKIVHNLLLAKLKPGELLEKYKMYEDVLPMLDYVSSEVIFAMNFKFDVERLNATSIFNIDEERILFTVASKKTNIILKVSLSIKVFNEIRADDVHVTCILGDVRKNDIKQLIVNIKKDSKFLSRYINDVRDYITLMEESTCFNKH